MKVDINPLDPMDQALRSRLQDSLSAQAPSWDSFLAHQSAKTTTHKSIRRHIYRIGSVAAMLALLVTASLYLFTTNDTRPLELTTPTLSLTSKNTLPQTQPLVAQQETPTIANPKKRLKNNIMKLTIICCDDPYDQLESTEDVTKNINQPREQAPSKTQNPKNTKKNQPQSRTSSPYTEEQEYKTVKRRGSPFALGAYSSLGYGSREISSEATPSTIMYTVGKYSGNMQVAESQFKHKFPVTVGLSLQYNLGKRFSVNSGITYSYLESTASRELNFQYNYSRKSHYVGVPLSLSYSMLNNRRIELYASVGAMAEWAVSSKLTSTLYSGKELISTTTTQNKTQGALFSANAALGVNVKITPDVGIYLEPGVSHYFDNQSHPVNFRTQWPVQFSLRAGVRVSL